MPAGGGDITEYTYITEKLNAKTIFLVDHNTLDTNTNFIMRLATRSLNFLNKSPLFHDLFNNSEIKWGSRLFWNTHFNFLDKMVQVSGVLNEQKRTILIGHSHSADAAFRVGKKYSDKMQSIKVVLIAPCFNLNRNYKEAHEIEVHVIFSGNETDGCARKYENKIIANRLTKNNGKIYTLDNATHYSMIEQSLFSMHNHKTLPESRESVIRVINNLLDDKQ